MLRRGQEQVSFLVRQGQVLRRQQYSVVSSLELRLQPSQIQQSVTSKSIIRRELSCLWTSNNNAIVTKTTFGKNDSNVGKQWHTTNSSKDNDDASMIEISFLQPNGQLKTVPAKIGNSFLQTAHAHEIDLEGACEGVCACSTCHLIFPTDIYDQLPEPSEDEEDMLDMAFGLTETSRLGCQVKITEEMNGMTVEMPKATRNFYVDGHVPKPH